MSNDDDEDWDDDLEDTTDVNAAVREERRQFTVREEIGEVIRDFKGYGWRLGAAALQLARWSGRIAWVGYTVMLFANLPLFMKVRPLSLLCAGGVPPLPARRLQKSACFSAPVQRRRRTQQAARATQHRCRQAARHRARGHHTLQISLRPAQLAACNNDLMSHDRGERCTA